MNDPLYDRLDYIQEPMPFRPSPALAASVEAHLEHLKQPYIRFELTHYGLYKITCASKEVYTLPCFVGDDIEAMQS